MQDQVKGTASVLIAVPFEQMNEVGIEDGSVLQMYTENGKLVIEPLRDPELVCDGKCEACPLTKQCKKERDAE